MLNTGALLIALILSFSVSAEEKKFVNIRGLQTYSPRPIQEVIIHDLDGGQLNLEDLNGNVVLLHFWASWCSHCVSGMKSLNALQKTLKKDQIIIVPVSQDFKGKEVVEKFYKDYKLSNLVAFVDPSHKLFRELDITSLPTTIIIDSRGMNVATIRSNIDWTNPVYTDFLRSHAHSKLNDNKKYLDLLEQQKASNKKITEIVIPDDAQTKVIIEQ